MQPQRDEEAKGTASKPPRPPPPGSPPCLLACAYGTSRGLYLETKSRGRVCGPSTAIVRVCACVCVYMCVHAVCGTCVLRGGSGPCPAYRLCWPPQSWSPRSKEKTPGRPRNDSSRQPDSGRLGLRLPDTCLTCSVMLCCGGWERRHFKDGETEDCRAALRHPGRLAAGPSRPGSLQPVPGPGQKGEVRPGPAWPRRRLRWGGRESAAVN